MDACLIRCGNGCFPHTVLLLRTHFQMIHHQRRQISVGIMADPIEQFDGFTFFCIDRTCLTACDQDPEFRLYCLFRKDASGLRLCPVFRKIPVCNDLHSIPVSQPGIRKADPGVIFSIGKITFAEALLTHCLSLSVSNQDFVP